jgi:hypothetical protein
MHTKFHADSSRYVTGLDVIIFTTVTKLLPLTPINIRADRSHCNVIDRFVHVLENTGNAFPVFSNTCTVFYRLQTEIMGYSSTGRRTVYSFVSCMCRPAFSDVCSCDLLHYNKTFIMDEHTRHVSLCDDGI